MPNWFRLLMICMCLLFGTGFLLMGLDLHTFSPKSNLYIFTSMAAFFLYLFATINIAMLSNKKVEKAITNWMGKTSRE